MTRRSSKLQEVVPCVGPCYLIVSSDRQQRRPLTDAQVRYAAADAACLLLLDSALASLATDPRSECTLCAQPIARRWPSSRAAGAVETSEVRLGSSVPVPAYTHLNHKRRTSVRDEVVTASSSLLPVDVSSSTSTFPLHNGSPPRA